MNLKALSIRQPYAEWILAGEKRTEYRSWTTNYRGPLLIHASKSTAEDGHKGLPLGYLVGMATLAEVVDPGNNEFWWILQDPARFVEPVPLTGKVGLFHVPLALIESSLIVPARPRTYANWASTLSRSTPTA